MATSNDREGLTPTVRVSMPEPLVGLADIISETPPADKEEIIPIGIRLEQAWTDLRVNGADKATLELLKTCLKTLQGVYQDAVANRERVWAAIHDIVAGVEAFLAGDDDAAHTAAEACAILQRTLAGDETPPAHQAEPVAEAHAGDETCGHDQASHALTALEALAGRLVATDADDTDEIKSVLDDLHAVIGMPAIAAAARGHLTVAATQIESVLQGKAANPQKALDAVAGALGTAGTMQEAYIEKSQQDDESPADEPAAEETPDADASDDPAETPEPVAETPAEDAPDDSNEDVAVVPDDAPDEPKKPAAPKIEFAGQAIMGEDCDPDLMKEFIVECLDHITNAEGSLLELESNSEDVDQISVIFRAFHTIKGTSGFLNLDRIQKCAHLAENLLDRARDGEIKITGGYADLALRSCDALRNMIEGLQGLAPGETLPIPEDLMDLLEILSDPEAAGYNEGDLDEPVMRTGDILVAEGKVSREKIEEAEKSKGGKKLGEKLVESKTIKPQDVANAIRKQQAQKQRATSNMADSSVRVSTGRLDSLINMVGELVIAQSMVAQDPGVTAGQSPRLQRNVSHAGKIIRELQDLTMSLRMVPLKGVFQKMNRLVRDLARKSGKKVQFVTEGEETEIDRNMVESLNDPLVHMIRNSVDHGVESPDVRQAQGKEPTGTVTLRAYHAAGNVVIELQDDGKGLAKDKIVAKAQERGIVDGTKELSDQEAFMLIFQAGFSTAEKITDVSGRGVGMDVVKRNIESLRGRIEVASKQGEGSTFSIRLPLTMAIADAMILRVGEETYLLPTVSIEQSFRPESGSISTVSGQGEMVMLRGELLPLFRLHELFNVSQAETEAYNALLIVIEGDGHRCALMVDELLGQQQVVIKSLGRGMAKVPGVSGGAILGDGRVGLILDATGLLQLAEGRIESEAETAMV